MRDRPSSLVVLREDVRSALYGPEELDAIARLSRPVAPPQTAESVAASPGVLDRVEVLMTGWGGPRLDAALLAAAPALRAVFYAGGSVAPIMTPEAWARGLVVSSAAAANADPVAEYTVSMLLLSLKGIWRLARDMRSLRAWPPVTHLDGVDRRSVGLVSLGAVGRAVVERLAPTGLELLAYDPFVDPADARALGVTLVPLPELFARADAVSVHAPLLPETVGLVRGAHLAAMKPGATFVNTAHADVVDEDALVAVASSRPDLQFVLDVTRTMPLPADSPLYVLPGVLLTPHVAGSRGVECRRLGRAMVDELGRYVAGQPLRAEVSRAAVARSAHGAIGTSRSRHEASVSEGACRTRA